MLKPAEESEENEEKEVNKKEVFFRSAKFSMVNLVELLNEKHLNAMLVNNKIYCGNRTIISIEQPNTLLIEGVISPEYYQVRDLIYSKYFKI
jgi:hypothetical protein